MMPEKLPDSKAPPLPRLPSVPASESTPVIPMSDSPPPSRWKPGQKPWKPSYVQEVKAKAALGSSSGPTVASVTEKAQTAVTPKCLLVDSEVHKRSRSYSRSRSRTYSRSSSYSGSDSETSQKAPSNKRNSLDKEWKEYYSSLKRVKNVDKYISHASSQDAKSGSNSPDVSKRSQDQEGKQFSSMPAESFNSRSEWDSDTERGGNSGARTKKQKRAVQSRGVLDKKSSAWNSESDSDHVTARNLAISEKEEGEASSESEFETSRKASEEVAAPKITKAAAAAKGPEEVAEKHKSKKKSKRKRKHKRRRESRKEKGKRSKRKHQKLKETFHWQPPLEFGEEEEEDESKREKQSPGRVLKDKPVVEKITSNPKEEKMRVQQRAKECLNKNSKHTESLLQPPNRNGADVPIVKQQESLDDMDICTPEHDAEIVQPTDLSNNAPEFIVKPTSTISDNASPQSKDPSVPSSAGLQDETPGKPPVINFKWRPLKGTSAPQNANMAPVSVVNVQEVQNASALGVKMEIKSQSRVRPGSLFDEVRKTARLNQRPRNEESSSEERSPSAGATRSPKKSRSRGWSRSSSRSRSRSRSSSYSSRSRSRSRRRRRRGRSRSRSTTYRRSHSRTYSRSRSRSRSRHRRRRSRSDSYDSYSSRSRSASRRRGRRRSRSSRSSERRSRSSRSSSRSSSSSRYS
ncbi:hypothetical protein OYC64_011458 [Pagothenia borchgrevinki]|uniref:NK-tumor recognition protein n=1 Tax=Pagothenia borchgrevinki TaxID=8213 RepID=A0ABD2FFW9_PAGBO